MVILKRPGILLHFLPFIILVSFLIGAYTDFSKNVSDKKHDMIQQLALTESNVNKVTNSNISKMIGVTTHISINPDIDIDELDYFIQKVVDSENNIISNIGIFKDTTAIYLYPYEPNKDMSNINLVDIPAQKDDALRVKNDLKVIITRPVELVQGGIGIITRMPITLPDGSYWGQLGYMMKLDDIIENLFLDTDSYTYLITQYDDNNFSHTIYDSGFEDKILVDEIIVNLPSGYWSVQIGYNNLFELTSPVFYIMIFSAIILFGLSIYIISKFKAYNTELLHLAQKKELILKEVHHRIKNNMNTMDALLRLQSDQVNAETSGILDVAAGRLQSMMVLYDKLYISENTGNLSLKEYLSSLIEKITMIFPKKVLVETAIEDISIDSKLLSSLGIIINELITNSMKYAFTGNNGRITIKASIIGNLITLEYQDNGVGIPESVTFENSTGFGMQLVKILVEQIDGNIRIERGNGTKFVIEFAA